MATTPRSSATSGRRALVTGAGGFIGRPVVQALLRRGWQVDAATLGPPPEEPGEARWHDVDLLHPASIARLLEEAGPTHLLHLAWHAGADIYGSPRNRRWGKGGLRLLREFAGHGGERAVFTGSCAEYDWDRGVCDEATTPLRPSTPYGKAKRELGERFAELVGSTPGLSGAWARPFFLFGPHEGSNRLLASVIRSLLEGEPARCSHGRQVRDYLYSVDLADGLVTLLESRVEGPINIASGQPTSIGHLVYRAAGRLGRGELVELGAIPARDDEPPLIVADVRRLREELGWTPRHTLDEALDDTIDWWRRRLAAARRVTA